MRRFAPIVAAVAMAAIQVACSGSGSEPLAPPNVSSADRSHAGEVRHIQIQDECDPRTFNAALGAGTCERPGGGVKFESFIAQLTRNKVAPGWHFAPLNLNIKLGQSFVATNMGGETHTFTEVEEYGGGIVPLLNQLSGQTNVAPECAALAPTDFLPRGASSAPDTPDEVEVEKYQCCIHPWMRMTVTIHGA
jgi:hypothetical protein